MAMPHVSGLPESRSATRMSNTLNILDLGECSVPSNIQREKRQ